MTTLEKNTENSIILSRGIFDLLRDHVNRKKLSKYNENKLKEELRHARQVLSKEIPADVVTINKKVEVIDTVTGEKHSYKLVSKEQAKRKNGTISILSAIGVAIIGYKVGSEITWEMPEGLKTYRIESISPL